MELSSYCTYHTEHTQYRFSHQCHLICLPTTQNILFAEPIQLLELVQLVGCLTLSHFWNCLSAVSDCWQEVSGWERTFPFFETQVKCGFRVGPVSQGWHTFQRISVFRIFVIVYFCNCVFLLYFRWTLLKLLKCRFLLLAVVVSGWKRTFPFFETSDVWFQSGPG